MRAHLSGKRREILIGILFIAPWIIGFLAFQFFPFVQTLYYSFTNFSLVKAPRWIGLSNYINISKDSNFWLSIKNTLFLTIIGTPIQLVIAFLCALLLNQKLKGQSFFRTIYILPALMPSAAVALLWVWIFNPQVGLVNTLLGYLGIHGPIWFLDPTWAKPSLIIMLCWMNGSTIIIYLAGLQGVPKELYESAELEGANGIQKIRYITIPLVSPVTLFNLITGLIFSFQMFTEPYMVSASSWVSGTGIPQLGSPQGSMLFYSIYLYQNVFFYNRIGKASALAWILFFLVMVVTLITLRVSRRWTSYDVR
jgi:multiple sugar transport system permease protein